MENYHHNKPIIKTREQLISRIAVLQQSKIRLEKEMQETVSDGMALLSPRNLIKSAFTGISNDEKVGVIEKVSSTLINAVINFAISKTHLGFFKKLIFTVVAPLASKKVFGLVKDKVDKK